MSALHLSAYEGDENIVRGRLELGEDPNARDEDGRTPLHWACAGGHQALVEYLAGLPGAVIDNRDEDGLTPLASAVAANKLVVAAFLLGKGADAKSRTVSGQSVLHFHKAHPEIIRLLLPYLSVTDVNAQDKWGNTPLHRCICGDSQDHLAEHRRQHRQHTVAPSNRGGAGTPRAAAPEGGRGPRSGQQGGGQSCPVGAVGVAFIVVNEE
eukprot:g9204.t2